MNAHLTVTEQPPYQGVDKNPNDRPGVPRETKPHRLPNAHWEDPTPQPVNPQLLARLGMPRETPVFSAAVPPKGASGAVRRVAYGILDHRVSHWMLLLFADRVDVVEHLFARAARRR